jgi:hypothetical protein
MTKKNILILPCSTQIGVEQFHSLKFNKHFNLFGASHNNYDSLFLNFIKLKNDIYSNGFIEEIINIIDKFSIDIILPAHDELNFILKRNETFSNLIPGSDYNNVILNTRFKSLTYQALLNNDNTKNLVPTYTLIKNKFIKPDNGQGSRGTLNAIEPHLICDFLPGREYTIDCFSNKQGDLIYANSRLRKVIENGISEETEIVNDKQFEEFAKNISQIFRLNGAWFFQMKENDYGELKLLEVAPRIAGGSNINRLNGVNLTALNLYLHLGSEPTIFSQNLVKVVKRKTPKYNLLYDIIFLDYDDTYPFVIDALKQLNKKIIIITRSKVKIQTPYETIYVKPYEKKSDIVKSFSELKGIFVDDSFNERIDVATNVGIPTIAPEEVEYLL